VLSEQSFFLLGLQGNYPVLSKQSCASWQAITALNGLLCDGSDTKDALWIVIILLYRAVVSFSLMVCSGHHTFLWGCYRCVV